MKRWIWSLLALCLAVGAHADNRSAELLARLQQSVGAMPGSRVEFAVEAEGHTFPGYYRVCGDSYYMQLGQAEVYCDGTVRREIDPVKREVVVDMVDPSSRNILNNPTRGFRPRNGRRAGGRRHAAALACRGEERNQPGHAGARYPHRAAAHPGVRCRRRIGYGPYSGFQG